MIALTADARDTIIKEGEAAYPNECCGFIIGRDGSDSSSRTRGRFQRPGGARRTRGRFLRPGGARSRTRGRFLRPGGARTGERVLPVDNARESAAAHHRFEITPKDFLRAEREAAAAGDGVIGVYHSHPDHPAAPSDYDLEHALPYYSYVIVSVGEGKAGRLTSWRLADDRSRFDEEEVATGGAHENGSSRSGNREEGETSTAVRTHGE
jgi:proteasome lid subunit RPN8/RPN11